VIGLPDSHWFAVDRTGSHWIAVFAVSILVEQQEIAEETENGMERHDSVIFGDRTRSYSFLA
jgi:hypothetical protein